TCCRILRRFSRAAAARSTRGTRRCAWPRCRSTTKRKRSATSTPRPSSPRMPARLPMEPARTLRDVSCTDDYDPNSLPVERARALIREFLAPVTAAERLHIRAALGRVLAADVLSPIDVPGHDNSAMDGWAVRFADLDPAGTTLRRVGESFAGKPFPGALGRGETVRIFTGGVMPPGADTVVMQERATVAADGVRIAASAVARAGQNRRFAGEDVKRGTTVLRA